MGINNRRLVLLSVTLVVLAMQLRAIAVDEAAARTRAMAFAQSHALGRLELQKPMLRLVHEEKSAVVEDKTDYYVFDLEGCFIIVSGDDRLSDVLAWGDGSFDASSLPCGMEWLLNHYKKQIDYLLCSSRPSFRWSHCERLVGNPAAPDV